MLLTSKADEGEARPCGRHVCLRSMAQVACADLPDLQMENMDILSQLQTKERDSMEVIKYLRLVLHVAYLPHGNKHKCMRLHAFCAHRYSAQPPEISNMHHAHRPESEHAPVPACETLRRDIVVVAPGVVPSCRKENEELQERLRKYKEEADEARDIAERTMRTANEERDRAIAEIETKFKTNDEVREAEVRKLREDLFSLKTFKDRKEVLEGELESVHQELFDAQTAHKEAMSGVERKLIEEKTRLQKEAHAQLMEIKRNTDEEVVNRLDVSTKRILQQNRRLAEDLKLHVQETADLQRTKVALEQENQRLKRDMVLNKEQVDLYSKEKFKNSREVKDLQTKVKNLEKSLSQVVKDFEKERDRLQSKGKAELEEMSVENSGLRKLLKLKEREHFRIKKLAQDIIAQRTEVEQFFLESLEQVRDEIVRERKERDTTFITSESSTHFGGRLPHIRGGSGGNLGGTSTARGDAAAQKRLERVDLKDLGTYC